MQTHLARLWEGCPKTAPLQVCVWLFSLIPDELHNMSLFDDDNCQQRLSRVVDELNQHFGKSAVYFANIQSVLDAAPTRISFTLVPDLRECIGPTQIRQTRDEDSGPCGGRAGPSESFR